jgi:hypothetical protein
MSGGRLNEYTWVLLRRNSRLIEQDSGCKRGMKIYDETKTVL